MSVCLWGKQTSCPSHWSFGLFARLFASNPHLMRSDNISEESVTPPPLYMARPQSWLSLRSNCVLITLNSAMLVRSDRRRF
ncbi:protein of unknown function [Candidatus Filomicrobium marinum]|nr:protein of unknown function [Candidatus Filomicrobium marinum]